VLRGEGKAQALWSAQQKPRRAKDPDGTPIYRTRDWAAWVLVGDPD
jgi:CHAT domain-containing protein